MQTLESLKHRIENAEDLATVVRTMKTLAAVSIRQYELAVESLTDYYHTIESGLQMVMWHTASPPALTTPAGQHGTGGVVFGSDQGMCGQFNEQMAQFAADTLKQQVAARDVPPVVLGVGTRVAARLDDLGLTVDAALATPGSSPGITPLVQDLLARIDAWRRHRRLGRVLLFYNRRRSASACDPQVEELLPVRSNRFRGLQQQTWPGRTLPAFTLNRQRLVSRLIRNYLFVCLFRAVAESLAAENASRIASMQAAERSIQERLTELRHNYHQQRQTAITEELLDVVTGFEALTGGTASPANDG